jgi:hypothetical protein
MTTDITFPRKNNQVWFDNFDGASIDSGWARVDANASSHVTWYQTDNKMTVTHDTSTDASASMHALMRPLPAGATYPFTIETHMSMMSLWTSTHCMTGLVFADGTTVSSGTQQWFMVWQTSAPSPACGQRDFSGYNSETASENIGGGSGYHGSPTAGMYLRFTWAAANSFTCAISIDNVQWAHSLTRARTLTPTHVGLAAGNWNVARNNQVTYKYFGMYDVADPQPIGPRDTL